MAMLVSSGWVGRAPTEPRRGNPELGSTAWQTQPSQSGGCMSTARELANFVTRIAPADLPAQALDHAAILVASTLASAAMGSGLESAKIVKDMASSLGGSPRATIWFDDGAKLPVVCAAQVNAVMSDAA